MGFVSFVWIKQTGHNLWKTSQELRHDALLSES